MFSVLFVIFSNAPGPTAGRIAASPAIILNFDSAVAWQMYDCTSKAFAVGSLGAYIRIIPRDVRRTPSLAIDHE